MTKPRLHAAFFPLCVSLAFGVIATVASSWYITLTARFHTMSDKEAFREFYNSDVVRVEHGVADVFVQRGPGIARYSAMMQDFITLNRGTTSDRLPTQVINHLRDTLKDVAPAPPPTPTSNPFPPGTHVCYAVGPMTSYICEAPGWPMPALMHAVTETDNRIRAQKWGLAVLLADELDPATGARFQTMPENSLAALPLCPLWPGFAVNTAFYGAVAWGILACAAALRKASRRRRGLCPACAYDRRGLASAATCPECGLASGRVDRRRDAERRAGPNERPRRA